ncbi:hypothetical protein PIB30_036916 [Stylosanthes scabra]|uniref:F-box domain-containing protein n=1 Tax=Stylosanthes scabra TaxID=79078 RepID=A0ABU6QD11_9FABA|nr:hypothetical protein [Stylosanthes scabra]
MSLNSLINEEKHKQHHMEEKNDESGINICDLPDPLCALIISFLPTKEAIRTSLLSKRWQHLWKDISKIDLNEEYRERQVFREFVIKLLFKRWQHLTKFSLSCSAHENAPMVNEWLRGFINPGIEELNLVLYIEKPLVLPHHLFSFARLTKFHLYMHQILELPSSILLPSLRSLSLSLERIIFPDSSSAGRLFSGCPSLEELTLIDCDWMNVKAITITSPLLQKVVIRDCKYDDFVDEEDEDHGIDNQNGSKCCEIFVDGTHLKSFPYRGFPGDNYSLLSSNSVIEATIHIDSIYVDVEQLPFKDTGSIVLNLFKKLSCVKNLRISEDAVKVMSIVDSSLRDLPVFSNLVELCLFTYYPLGSLHPYWGICVFRL